MLGRLRLTDISPLHVEELLQARLKSGVSTKTVRNLVVLVQGIFSVAVDNDFVSRSPVRNKGKPALQHREKPTWRAEQVRAIVESVPSKYRALFVCAAVTGVRLGELPGLKWQHVDSQGAVMRIQQSLWHGEIFTPKTQASIRLVPLGNHLLAVLKGHQRGVLHTGPEDFAFCKEGGLPLNPDVLRKDVLYPPLDRLQIARTPQSAGFPTFRHSAVSFINEQTGNLKLVQKLLGHSNLNITSDVYTHTSAEAEREAVLAVERAIYGDLFPVVPKMGNGNKAALVN
jgi:integrase